MEFIFFGEIFPDQIIDIPDSNKALEYIEAKYYRDDIVSVNMCNFDGQPVIKIKAWADISGDDDEDCVSYERRPMYLATEHSYRKLSPKTIKLLIGEQPPPGLNLLWEILYLHLRHSTLVEVFICDSVAKFSVRQSILIFHSYL